MKYNVKYFIRKFSRIPEDKWITGQYVSETGNAFCALGHCGARMNAHEWDKQTDESNALIELFRKYNLHAHKINDGKGGIGATPKQRILNALKGMV